MYAELKIKKYTPAEIAAITGGSVIVFGDNQLRNEGIAAVSTNSKDTGDHILFAAIKGERFDAHDFIGEANANGACFILASKLPSAAVFDGRSCVVILVEDVVNALGQLANDYRRLAGVKVVAVTGSVGKTTTKEFIYAVASAKYSTHKTDGNKNTELGLPMTLFGLLPEHEVVVLEMGMSGFGEIEHMSKIAEPDIAVITNIGTSHMEMLGSRENICRAKLEIRAGMKKDGTLLMNADEVMLFNLCDTEPRAKYMSIYNRRGDFRAVNIRHTTEGLIYDLIYHNKAVTNVTVPALGQHNVYNSLAAYAVGVMLGMNDEQIRRGLLSFKGAEMRQKIYDVNGITVIDDCYNASPESMRAALDVLMSIATQKQGGTRAAALLGDMRELGEYSRLMHDQLGQYAAQKKVEILFAYGMYADVIAEAAIKKGIRADNVYVCLDTGAPQTMADMINNALMPGDILLVKASRAVAAENVIEALKKKKSKRPLK